MLIPGYLLANLNEFNTDPISPTELCDPLGSCVLCARNFFGRIKLVGIVIERNI
jgi:hypothetical protein